MHALWRVCTYYDVGVFHRIGNGLSPQKLLSLSFKISSERKAIQVNISLKRGLKVAVMTEGENSGFLKPKYESHNKQRRLLRLCRSLAICLLTIPIEASALTFKSDGSVVQKSSAVVRADDASRYQAALDAFNEPSKTGQLGGAGSARKSGYFGEQILGVGAPFTPFVMFEVQATQ